MSYLNHVLQISVPTTKVVELTEKLLNYDNVRLAGLGARDTLRLEAGLCLYGNDLTEDITPVEASLTWCIGTLCMYLLHGGEIATTCI